MTIESLKRNLLVIDDEQLFCQSVKDYLTKKMPLQVFLAHTCEDGLKECSCRKIDVVILDQKLPDGRGVDLCSSILEYNEGAKIIFITAYPSFDNAVEAIRTGAYDYLSKPFEPEQLLMTIERALKTQKLEKVEQTASYHESKEKEDSRMIGIEGGLAEINKLIKKAAFTKSPVLISGETGTGKNLVARQIVFSAKFDSAPFVSENCAAIAESLIESELFGHEKGAFTGADKAHKGLFEMADEGTLFLDEIGEIPLRLQPKLLGVLDDKKFRRVGGQTTKRVDVRIITASNIDLEQAVAEKSFREDLYHRISVIRIHLPPLRDRLGDLPQLCKYFLNRFAAGSDLKLAESEIEGLANYNWPGNIRELKNVIERAIFLQEDGQLKPTKLLKPELSGSSFATAPAIIEIASLDDYEKDYIGRVLEMLDNNRTRTAKLLGVSRSTLIRKIERYRL
jgi:DNA-binding NtrC family response regulator